jgi:hypothetical protein
MENVAGIELSPSRTISAPAGWGRFRYQLAWYPVGVSPEAPRAELMVQGAVRGGR